MRRWKLWLLGGTCVIALLGYLRYRSIPEGVSLQETIFKRSYTFDDSIVKQLTFSINGKPAFNGTLYLNESDALDLKGEIEVTPESGLIQGGDGAMKPIAAMLVCRPPGSDDWESFEVDQRRDIIVSARPSGKKGLGILVSRALQAPPPGEYEMRLIVNFGKHPLSELTSYWLARGKLVVRPSDPANP